MIETGVIREFEPGFHSVMLPPCSTAVLLAVLDPSVPFVWVVGHWPGSHVHWWAASLPLFETTPNRRFLVRDLEFDIQLSTNEFLQLEPEFRHGGILLIQLDRPVPDTLSPGRGSDAARYRILRENGFRLEFQLPHPGEYASVVSPDRGVLEAMATRLQYFNGDLP